MERKSLNLKNKQKSQLETALDFFVKFRNTILGVIGAVVFVLVVVGGFAYYNYTQNEKAVQLFDSAMNYINNISYITNQETRGKVYQESVNQLVSVVQMYPNTVPAMRARLFLGRVYFEEGAYRGGQKNAIDTAITYYRGVYEQGTTPFYRALGAIAVAQCYEQKGDKPSFEEAYNYYYLALTQFPTEGFNEASLIGMARCKEMLGDVNTAIQYYERIAKEYTNSLWVRFAKGKLYLFQQPAPAIKQSTNAAATSAVAEPATSNVPIILPQ